MPPYNNPKKTHKKNSIAWQYFTPEGDTASCKVCGRSYKYTNGGTSMLLRHVKYHQTEENGTGPNLVNAQNVAMPQDNTQLVANQNSPSVNNSSLLLPTSRHAQPEQANSSVTSLQDWNMGPQQRQPAQVSISPKTNFNNQVPEIQHPLTQAEFTTIPDSSLLSQKEIMDNRGQPVLPSCGPNQETTNLSFSGAAQNSTSYYQPPPQTVVEGANIVNQGTPIKQQQQQQSVAGQRFQSQIYPVPSNINQTSQSLPQLSPQELMNTPADYPQSQFEHDLVDLFLNNNIPYSIIESPEFVRIFKKLVPYKLYSARLLRLIVITKIHLQGNQILENLTNNQPNQPNTSKNQDRQP